MRLRRLDGEAAEAVHRVAGAVEQVLYAPEPQPGAGAGRRRAAVRAGLRAGASRGDAAAGAAGAPLGRPGGVGALGTLDARSRTGGPGASWAPQGWTGSCAVCPRQRG